MPRHTTLHFVTYLDTSHLQRVDRIGHTILQLVFDSSCTEHEQVSLDELGRLV